MSVRRKGPKATAIRVLAYVVLVLVAVVVAFPFGVALTTAFKNNDDIFRYPPTLVPREASTVAADRVGAEGDPLPLYTLPDRAGTFALIDPDVSVAEFRPLDDLERVVTLEASAGEKTGDTVLIDEEEEDIFIVEVDGEQVEAYRARLTSGGQFQNVDDSADAELGLINLAVPVEQFGPRPENFSDVWTDKELGRSLSNTVLVTFAVVIGQIVTSILGGYAFARIDFKGRNGLFMLYLGSVMVPFVVLIIPLFQRTAPS